MFGNGKETGKPARPSTSANAAGGVNTIDERTIIRGNIEAGGDIRIDGRLIGNLSCNSKVIIGEFGTVTGDIECENALIDGTYIGNLTVRELLTVRETGRVTGTIRAAKLAVGSGSVIDGQCTVTGEAPTPFEEPSSAPSSQTTNGASNEA